ncbi:unnamed protein product [Adineta ricciae]|uniref:Uncharacterized protein n=1 Tax=Adineta ricciae TaxID=249248 RepID=A0A816EYI8_ADIRI|nr:unnamed protein product [Adineta ricciae]
MQAFRTGGSGGTGTGGSGGTGTGGSGGTGTGGSGGTGTGGGPNTGGGPDTDGDLVTVVVGGVVDNLDSAALERKEYD